MVYEHEFILYKITSCPEKEEEGVFTIHPDLSSTLTEKVDLENAFLNRLKDCSSKKEIEQLIKYQFESSTQHNYGPWIKGFYEFFMRLIMTTKESPAPWQFDIFSACLINNSIDALECRLDVIREREELNFAKDSLYYELPYYRRVWVYFGKDESNFTRIIQRLMEMTKVNPPLIKRLLEDWFACHPDQQEFYHQLCKFYFNETINRFDQHTSDELAQLPVINMFIEVNRNIELKTTGELQGLKSTLSKEALESILPCMKTKLLIANNTNLKDFLAVFHNSPLPKDWTPILWIGSRTTLYAFLCKSGNSEISLTLINKLFKFKNGRRFHESDKGKKNAKGERNKNIRLSEVLKMANIS
jgi:hypothetical protein